MAAAALSTSAIAMVSSAAISSRKQVVAPSRVSVAKAFGLKSRNMGRVTCAAYNVTLIHEEEGTSVTLEVPEDVFILDHFEEAGHDLPYSCRSGSCSSCAGVIKEGSVDQSDGTFLDDEQLNNNFVLTCVAKPTSDVTIFTHREEDLI